MPFARRRLPVLVLIPSRDHLSGSSSRIRVNGEASDSCELRSACCEIQRDRALPLPGETPPTTGRSSLFNRPRPPLCAARKCGNVDSSLGLFFEGPSGWDEKGNVTQRSHLIP